MVESTPCEHQAQAQLCPMQQTGVHEEAQVACSSDISFGLVTPQEQQLGGCDANTLQHANVAKLPKPSKKDSQTDGNQAGLHVAQVGQTISRYGICLLHKVHDSVLRQSHAHEACNASDECDCSPHLTPSPNTDPAATTLHPCLLCSVWV